MLADLSKDEAAAESRGEASLHGFSLRSSWEKLLLVSEGVSLPELRKVTLATPQLFST